MSDLEERVKILEKQVAELMQLKRRVEHDDLAKALRSVHEATDGFYVDGRNPMVEQGFYCLPCWEGKDILTRLDIEFNKVPRAMDRRQLQCECPECRKTLNLQFENLP